MTEPLDPFTKQIVQQHGRGELPVEGAVAYRFPRISALVGVAMMLGGGLLAGTGVQQWRSFPAEPIAVSGTVDTAHTGQWIRWDHSALKAAEPPVASGPKIYLAVPHPQGRLVWISSKPKTPFTDVSTGVLKPATRTVLLDLQAARPADEHLILWTHAGPGNSKGLVVVGLAFLLLGAFVTAWFVIIGRRVHARLAYGRPDPPSGPASRL